MHLNALSFGGDKFAAQVGARGCQIGLPHTNDPIRAGEAGMRRLSADRRHDRNDPSNGRGIGDGSRARICSNTAEIR